MCLLDRVLSWNVLQIRCAAASQQATNNPLRRNNSLGIMCGIEYAAQAMALHGVLVTDGAEFHRPRVGYLATLRELAWHEDRLDLLPGYLDIRAERLHVEARRVIYNFALRHEDRVVLEGRAAIVLEAGG